ncbi:MAG: helix-turn-helix domain-containing protein [Oligoflexales bacterium]
MKIQSPKDRGSWDIEVVGPDRIFLKRQKSHKEYYENFEIQGNFHALFVVKKFSGDVCYLVDDKEVRPQSTSFGLFLPAFSIAKFASINMALEGYVVLHLNPGNLSLDRPTLFQAPAELLDTPDLPFDKFLSGCANFQDISVSTKPSNVSRRAKDLISEHFHTSRSLAEIAADLKTSGALMAREFKSDFKLSPSDYRKRIRIATAAILLALGSEPGVVSDEVGYEDLSRFYKQFKELSTLTPGAFKKSKNAKRV